ncbi:hypothetical protein ACMGGS_11465 [Superficieibacter sp. BNK-5]
MMTIKKAGVCRLKVDDKPVCYCVAFCRVAASPYPAYEKYQYQQVIRNP